MAGAVEPAVDWGQEVAALQGSSEWQELLADLAAAPGGPSVAALLRHAAAAAAAAAAASAHGSGSGTGRSRLAEAVQQVAWEKLHSGDWHTVAVVWRDTYAAACILAAAAGLPGGGEAPGGSQPGTGQAAGQQHGEAAATSEAAAAQGAAPAEAAALAAALWHFDMAAIMGGALLRPLVDSLIHRQQRRWQQLHGAGKWQPPAGQRPVAAGSQEPQAAAGAGEGCAQPPAKRRRQEGEGAPTAAAEEATAAAAAAAARAADAALLPPGSLGPRGTPVAIAELPSLEAFWRDYMSTDTPVVVTGAMEDWPALTRWCDPAYLIAVAGPRTVPVEVGEHYLAEGWGQQLMTLQQFVEQHIAPRGVGGCGQGSSSRGSGGQGPGAAGEGGQAASDLAMQPQGAGKEQRQAAQQGAAEEAQAQRQAEQQEAAEPAPHQQPGQQGGPAGRGYLAQHPLFDQIPALAADIREPPYCVLGEGEVQSINAWLGPPGTVTPLHTDPHPNLLCQAAGRKYVRLCSPAHTQAMYPHAEGMHTNTGQVDVDAPDHERHPLFAAAPFQDCVLEPGQMLFIPPGWWHYVKSTTVSFSVSFWWR